MTTWRIVFTTSIIFFSANPIFAQHEWVGEVFYGWGNGNTQVRSMAAFDGDLYAGTYKNDGADIYVRAETPPWVPSAMDGFGTSSSQHAPAMVSFEYFLGTWINRLYVGVSNFNTGGQVWAYDGSNPWYLANTAGFGDSNNGSVNALATFADSLWAGTFNSNGAEMHSFSGVTWTQKMSGGFGDTDNSMVSKLVEHNGKLYAGTYNDVDGGGIWWTSNGADWFNIVPSGFFTAEYGVSAMASTGDALYAAVSSYSGVEVWRIDPSPIVQVNSNGFGASANSASDDMITYSGELYAGTVNDSSGGQIWRLRGTQWSQVNTSGFGDVNNRSIRSMGIYNEQLFAGTWNSVEGCQMWRYPIIFGDNFESGSTIGWSATVQ